jgi:cobalt-zinc-cadmium efflux system membrane fusion protein
MTSIATPQPTVAPTPALPPSPLSTRKRRRLAVIALVLVAIAGLAAIAVRLSKPKAAPAIERNVPVVEGDRIRFPAEFAKRAGIATAPVERRVVSPWVVVPGSVELDPRRVAAVGARIPGRVREVFKFEGDEVRPGDVLAEIESPELGQAQTELLKARAREAAAVADRVREDRLAKEQISSLRDAQAARAAAASASAERLGAEQAVRALGGSADTIGEIGILKLRAPIAGRVLSSKLTRGKSLEGTGTPFLIGDLARVWIRLEVFERDLAAVRVGDPVEVVRQADSSRAVEGHLARTGEVVDPQTHTAEVWVEVDNAERQLRPGESVTARIRGSGGGGAKWPAVPVEALVTIDGKPTVFVAVAEDAVQIRPVTLGTSGEKYTAVVKGLEEGERLVVSGAFALKSEIFR